MSYIEKKLAKDEYNIIRRKWIDQQRKLRLKCKAEVDIDRTGVGTSTLRTMKEVEDDTRLAVGQMFPSREIILLRTAEEANLRGIYFTILKSYKYTFHSSGVRFCISATNSESSGWKITKCSTREGGIGMDVLAPDDPDNAAASHRSPFRAKWLIPLIHSMIAEAPMASSMMLRAILKPYAKSYVLTDALLQVARCEARKVIFGTPSENVKFTHHVANRLREQGHHVSVKYTTRKQTIKNIERLVVSEELLRLKANNETLSAEERRNFVQTWKREHEDLLVSQLG